MANKVILGLVALLAIVMAVAPDLDGNTGGLLAIALVVLGVAHAVMSVDAEDATGFLALAIAAGAAAGADVFGAIPAIGGYLDGIADGLSTALYAGALTVLGTQVVNRLKG